MEFVLVNVTNNRQEVKNYLSILLAHWVVTMVRTISTYYHFNYHKKVQIFFEDYELKIASLKLVKSS